MTLSVRVKVGAEVVYETWALNEATRREGEPGAHARGRDRGRRPSALALRLRRRGHLDADRLHRLQLLRGRPGRLAVGRGHALVPLCAHALFAQAARGRPGIVRSRSRCWNAPTASACSGATAAGPWTSSRAPGSVVAARRRRSAWRACIQSTVHRPARRQVRAAGHRLARPCRTRGADDRHDPPPGLHGHPAPQRSGGHRMIEEIEIRDLGVIAPRHAPARSRFHRAHRRDRRRQDDGGHRARAAARSSGRTPAPCERARTRRASRALDRAGRRRGRRARPRGRGRPRARGSTRQSCCSAGIVTAEGRGRAVVGGRAAPVGILAEIGEQLVVVHGQSDQIRLRCRAGPARRPRPLRR